MLGTWLPESCDLTQSSVFEIIDLRRLHQGDFQQIADFGARFLQCTFGQFEDAVPFQSDASNSVGDQPGVIPRTRLSLSRKTTSMGNFIPIV